MLQDRPLQSVLEALCDGVVALGIRMGWVAFKNPDYTVRPLASRGLATDYVESIRVRWGDTREGRGPTGRAIWTGHPMVCLDTEEDPDFAPWRDQARRRGFRSTAGVPLTTNGDVLGALNVYSERRHGLDPELVHMLETLAQQATLAIVTARQREEFRRIQQLQDFHVEPTPLAHILWDADFRVVRWNRSAERIFGWRAEAVLGRPAWESLMPPEERSLMENLWKSLLQGASHRHAIQPAYRRDGTGILYG